MKKLLIVLSVLLISWGIYEYVWAVLSLIVGVGLVTIGVLLFTMRSKYNNLKSGGVSKVFELFNKLIGWKL